MNVAIKKLTDVNLLRLANSFTSGKDSKMSLATAYKNGHSTIRTQLFTIELTDIPLFVASQLVRQTQGVNWYQRSKRTDRDGEDFRVECHDLGQRLDLFAESLDLDMNDWALESKIVTLNNLEREVKSWGSRFDRYTPTNLMCVINAEALMNMAHKRLCAKASAETRLIVQKICEHVAQCDPDLYPHLVPQCIYRGGICPEHKPCGYHKNAVANEEYRSLFN